jgi:hypothetical protein
MGYLLLAGLALGSSGCLAAVIGGAAAGGATGLMYYQGQVCRTYPAAIDDVWAATHTALAELQMTVQGQERTTRGGSINSHTKTDPVRITLEVQQSKIPADGPLTWVGVRVATFGDEAVSLRILDQIARHLVPTSSASSQQSAVSGQQSAVSGQQSAVSGQQSAVSDQRPATAGPVPLTRQGESVPPPLAEKK